MRKSAVLVLAGLLSVALASAALAQQYDRYEKYGGPPPRRGAGAPPPQPAGHGQTSLFGHVGLFQPNDDDPTPTGGGLGGYDTGGSFDIGIGSRVTPNLAIEGEFGGDGGGPGSGGGAGGPPAFR